MMLVRVWGKGLYTAVGSVNLCDLFRGLNRICQNIQSTAALTQLFICWEHARPPSTRTKEHRGAWMGFPGGPDGKEFTCNAEWIKVELSKQGRSWNRSACVVLVLNRVVIETIFKQRFLAIYNHTVWKI